MDVWEFIILFPSTLTLGYFHNKMFKEVTWKRITCSI